MAIKDREIRWVSKQLLEHFDIKEGDWPGIHGRTYSGDKVWCLVDTEMARLLFRLQELVSDRDFE